MHSGYLLRGEVGDKPVPARCVSIRTGAGWYPESNRLRYCQCMTEQTRDWSKVRRGVNEGRIGRPAKNRHGPRTVEILVRVNEAEKAWIDAQMEEGEPVAGCIRRLISYQVPPKMGLFVDQGPEVPT